MFQADKDYVDCKNLEQEDVTLKQKVLHRVNMDHGVSDELDYRIYLQGQIFYSNSYSHALYSAQRNAKSPDGVFTLSDLIRSRAEFSVTENPYDDNFDNSLWGKWCCGDSGEYVGKTSRGKPVVVLAHGYGPLSDPKVVRKKLSNKELIDGAIKLSDEEFDRVLNGKPINGEEVPVFSLADVIRNHEIKRKHRFGIVIDYDKARRSLPNEDEFTYSLRDNPLMIARAGSKKLLGKYLDKVEKIWSDEEGGFVMPIYHRLGKVRPSIPHGRVLFLADSDEVGTVVAGFFGDSKFSYAFISMTPKSRQTFNKSRLDLHKISLPKQI